MSNLEVIKSEFQIFFLSDNSFNNISFDSSFKQMFKMFRQHYETNSHHMMENNSPNPFNILSFNFDNNLSKS